MKRITRIRGQETVGSYSYRARLMGVIFVIATIIIIAVTFATFFMSYHTALAQADSPGSINDETASPINAELTTNDKNSGVGEAAAATTRDMIVGNSKTSDIINNNVITSIIENAQTPGGLSINGTLNQLGAFNYTTSSITGNAFMQKIALSGKIASSQFNFQSGNVVATLFGNWSLHAESFNNANLTADFTMRGAGVNDSSSNTGEQIREFRINGLKLNSFQQIKGSNNDNNNTILSLVGTSNLAALANSQNPQLQSLNDVPISITIIQNKLVIFTFDANEDLSDRNSSAIALLQLFKNLPIIGIVPWTT